LLVLPTGRFLKSYTVSTPAEFPFNFLNVIAERYAPRPVVDGQRVPVHRFTPIGNSGYWGAQIPVQPGAHTVSSPRPVGVAVYGFHEYDAYTYLGGVSNAPSASVVAVCDAYNTPSNTAVIANVLANDVFTNLNDVVLTVVSNPSNGTAVVTSGTNITYTPHPGYVGTDQFTYQIAEREHVATAPVTIWIGNRPPVALGTNVVACAWTPTVIPVLVNDSDPDGDPLNILSASQPDNADVEINSDNTITFNGEAYNQEAYGSNSFTYSITDGRGGSATATVYVTVNPSPEPVVDSVLVCQGQTTAIPVLDNDWVPGVPGAVLTLDSVTDGEYGYTEIEGTNVTYTPYAADFVGNDEFTYTVRYGQCTLGTSVYVSVVNPVQANYDWWEVFDSQPTTIQVLANDYALCGGTLTIISVTDGEYGEVVINQGSTNVVYAPGPEFDADDEFTYTVTDGQYTNSAAVVVWGSSGMPYATILSPTNGSTVSGVTTVEVFAVDNGCISSVTLVIDGSDFATITYEPFSFPVNTAVFSNGLHSIHARVADNAGDPSSGGNPDSDIVANIATSGFGEGQGVTSH
jgi:hypothetical protein